MAIYIGILFVVDSTDRERMEEACDYLHETMLHDDIPPQIPVVIVANKQDLPGMSFTTRFTSSFTWYLAIDPKFLQYIT